MAPKSLPYPQTLLVAEGFDRVEAGGLPGGIDGEADADHGAENERGDDPEKGELCGHVRAIFHQHRKERTERDAENAADGAESDSLNEELQKDVAAFCADGFADADFPRTFRNADEHDIHHADAADEQAYRGDGKH